MVDVVEVLMDLHVRFDVNVLKGSCVDEPLAVGDDLSRLLSADEIPCVLCHPDLGKIVLEDLVEVPSLSGIWNQQAHLHDAVNDEVEQSGGEQVDQRQHIRRRHIRCQGVDV